jgi:hypothetical protein
MSNGKMSRENRKHLKDEIESLLTSISTGPQSDMVVDDQIAEQTKAESPYDFEKISQDLTNHARKITDSIYKNFVDIGIFEKNDYHKHKKELDTIHISNLFFQLKTIKMTIIRVMEEITAGNTHPRLIEVMGQLQDKMAAITKMQANYMLFLEETYRKLNEPSQNPNDVNLPNNPEEGQFFVSVGTKNVIKNLPDAKGATENSSTRLTDPSSKADLMKERNVQIEKDPEDDDFIDLTEII